VNRKIWTAIMLGCLAVSFGAWEVKRSRLAPSRPAPPAAEARQSELVLTGSLEPVVSAVIPASEIELDVPMYSWVSKGQILGEGLTWTEEQRRSPARMSRRPDGSSTKTRDDLERDESALMNAQIAEQDAERSLAAVSSRYRQQTAGMLAEDDAAAAQQHAASALTGVQRSVDQDMAKIGEQDTNARPERRGARGGGAAVVWSHSDRGADGRAVGSRRYGRIGGPRRRPGRRLCAYDAPCL
jgi:hypothetical protein